MVTSESISHLQSGSVDLDAGRCNAYVQDLQEVFDKYHKIKTNTGYKDENSLPQDNSAIRIFVCPKIGLHSFL